MACRSFVLGGETDVNSRSIGIEIANLGHEHGYPDFPRRQIAAVTALCRSILTRHDVPGDRVLAHSDVAPARKLDPGEKFPWKLLAQSGIGLWVKPAPLSQGGSHLCARRNGSRDRGSAKAARAVWLRRSRHGIS